MRSLESLPGGPLWLGLLVWGLFMALWLAWCAIFGELGSLTGGSGPLGLTTAARIEIVIGLLFAFMLVTGRHAERSTASAWKPIQPLTSLSPEAFRDFVQQEVAKTRVRRPWLDALGVLTGVSVVFASDTDSGWTNLRGWDANFVWALGATALVFVMMTRAAYRSRLAASTQRIADQIEHLDLLDTKPLRCFGRQGLRIAFHWLGGSCVASLLAWNLDRIGPLLAILLLTLSMATFSLLAPVRVVRQRILSTKEQELREVRARIHRARNSALAGADASALPGLLAYEERVLGVSEWPFDTSTLLRFGALAVVASGSWLGGAVVERLLDFLLN